MPLYTPKPFAAGSSVSHLDTEVPEFRGRFLMTHSSAKGQRIRTLSTVEQGMLSDMGFNVIPESSSLILLFTGGLLTLRRARSRRH